MNRHVLSVSCFVISILLGLSFVAAHARADTIQRTPSASGCTPYYVVRSGDTLSAIARRCGVSTNRLAQTNGLRLTSVIYPGQRLVMPGTATTSSTTSTTSTTSQSGGGCPSHYTVRAGDTLGAIAARCGTSVANLKQWNSLRSDMIWIGQLLNTRSTWSPATAPLATPSDISSELYAPATPMPYRIPALLPEVLSTPTPCIESPVSPW